jgi:hypothetical protein
MSENNVLLRYVFKSFKIFIEISFLDEFNIFFQHLEVNLVYFIKGLTFYHQDIDCDSAVSAV